MNNKKYRISLGILVLLMAITFYIFLKDNAISKLIPIVKQANSLYILAGLFAMFLAIVCEAYNIKVITKSFKQKVSFNKCLKYSFIGFYFSAITPSASGGPPAQVYYMQKDNIHVSLSTIVFLVIGAIYQAVMLIFGLVMFLFKYNFVTENVKGIGIFLIYGVTINIILLTSITFMIFSKKLVNKFVMWSAWLLSKMRIVKDLEKTQKKASELIKEYKKGAEYIKQNPIAIIKIFVGTAMQLTLIFLVPFLVYKAFGLNSYGVFDVLAVQSLLNIGVSSLPLPGAVGVTESSFMLLFKVFFNSNLLLPAMILSRGISFYAFLIISGLVVFGVQLKASRAK